MVITGGSSGIGRSTALHCAARGARVVVTARRGEALDEVVREVEIAGGTALAVPGDVTRKDDLRSVAEAALSRFGRIDTWVNCAGVYIQGRVQDLTLEEFRRVLDVNLVGLINGTQCALDAMLPRRSGTIVQVSSVAARRGVPYTSAYAAAKAGIDGFTSAIRSELWGSGVHFAILYPPTVDTPIYASARAKLGVVPKPAPPIEDPARAAREIARLAVSPKRHRFFGWAGPLAVLDAVSPAAGDWLLHHVAAATWSDRPPGDDNLYAPSADVAATERDGWADPGWRGLTVQEAVRVLPWESMIGAASAGYLAARAMKWLRRASP
jgi:NAD(P)-dependent dehydrogenase (short-subunit alcohol dehydrogenase family)